MPSGHHQQWLHIAEDPPRHWWVPRQVGLHPTAKKKKKHAFAVMQSTGRPSNYNNEREVTPQLWVEISTIPKRFQVAISCISHLFRGRALQKNGEPQTMGRWETDLEENGGLGNQTLEPAA